jgi:putative component of membrane protein insertase Oxa1/YidC/SpoIIIJ protein YidD
MGRHTSLTAWPYTGRNDPGEVEMLSEEEQEEAWHYVCQRVLERPPANIFNLARNMLVFLMGNILLTAATYMLFAKYAVNSIFSMPLLFAVYMLLSLFLFSKKAIVGLIHLYQHYAPERIRRKCIFKPTCSEYMILALQKYGLVKGLYKGVYRLFFKCRGFVYSIDYP